MAVDDSGVGHDAVGSLGNLTQRAAVLLVGLVEGADDGGYLVADGAQRRVISRRYCGVGHGRYVGAAELPVEEKRVGGVWRTSLMISRAAV